MEGLISFIRSLRTASGGVVWVVRTERNARLHLLVAILVLVCGIGLGVSNAALAALFFAIILVFTAEIVNTALERTLDLLHPQPSQQVRIIKDIAAGAVLVAAAGAVAIGIAIFWPYIINGI